MAYDPKQDQYRVKPGLSDPSGRAVAVTPSDTADLAPYPRSLYVGVSGNVTVIPKDCADNESVTFVGHPVGYMPCQVRRVLATGTTATNILALL